MKNVFKGIVKIFSFSFLVGSLFLLSGCSFSLGPKTNPLLNSDCTVSDTFDEGWQKYSDFDYRIDPATRSYDARSFHEAQEKIVKLGAEVVILKRDYEIAKEKIKVAQDYKIALKAGHKINLIKTVVRMSYITYKVIDSAKGTAQLYSSFLTTSEAGVKVLGKAIKIGRDLVPPKSMVALDTNTIEGKADDVLATGWVETFASFGDPEAVVIEVMKKVQGHAVPKAELTDEELNILRHEHNKLKRLDKNIVIDTNLNIARLQKSRDKEVEINKLKSKLWEYEAGEKDRVRNSLIRECKGDQKEWWKDLLNDAK